MKRVRLFYVPFLALAFSLSVLLSPLFAQTFKPVFTKQYTRLAGTPVTASDSFTACDPKGSFRIIVLNGPTGQGRISSGSVFVNGVEVVQEKDFSQKVDRIERPLRNTLQNNQIDVRLRSGPGGAIQLTVEGIQNCLGITITSPAPGSVINRSSVLVLGEVLAPAGTEVGVTVNGVAGLVSNGQFAARVPLALSVTALSATVRDAAGNTGSDTIPITVQPLSAEMLFVTASPSSGAAPLRVNLRASFLGPATNYQWDADGNGTIDFQGPTLAEISQEYLTSGLYLPTVTVTDRQGAQFTEGAPVLVFSRDELIALLQSKWQGFKNSLRSGDVSGALQLIVQGRRDRYRQVFQNLTVPLSSIDQVLTDIRFVQFRGQSAEFEMLRTDERGTLSYLVRFVIDQDGIWRIKDM